MTMSQTNRMQERILTSKNKKILFTAKETAYLLFGCSESSYVKKVRKMCVEGNLEHFKDGQMFYITRAILEQMKGAELDD